jgi:hypothetical protein
MNTGNDSPGKKACELQVSGKSCVIWRGSVIENDLQIKRFISRSIITSNDIPTLSRMEYNKQPLKI